MCDNEGIKGVATFKLMSPSAANHELRKKEGKRKPMFTVDVSIGYSMVLN